MNKEKKNRKEWIKNFAIIFLAVLLVLTFFSNTILNYSLPEVGVTYVYGDNISQKVRGTGTVEGEDPYQINVEKIRKIKKIPVRVGDVVKEGDVLLYYDMTQSDEVDEATAAYEAALEAYDRATLSIDITSDLLAEVKAGKKASVYRDEISAAQKEVDKAKNEVAKAEAELNKTKAAIDALNAQKTIDRIQDEISVLDDRIALSVTVSDGNAGALTSQKLSKQNELINAQANYNATMISLDANNTAALNAYNDKNATLSDKQKALDDLSIRISKILNLRDLLDAVDSAKENLDNIKDQRNDETLLCEKEGIISEINVYSGGKTDPATPAFVIEPIDATYHLSLSVDKKQASKVNVGDIGDIANGWWYSDVNLVVDRIHVDPQNPAKNMLIDFKITGDVMVGQTFTVTVGQKSAYYDVVVPNSAIKEDNNGKFVLVVESKNTPLGNRYIAKRYNVEVLVSDDTKSAVSGDLKGWEYVITACDKPISSGDQVRLSDNY